MPLSDLPYQSETWVSPSGRPITFRGTQSYVQPYLNEGLLGGTLRNWGRGIAGAFGRDPKIPENMSQDRWDELQKFRSDYRDFKWDRLLRNINPVTWWNKAFDPKAAKQAELDAVRGFYTKQPMLWSQREKNVYRTDPSVMQNVLGGMDEKQRQRTQHLVRSGYMTKALAKADREKMYRTGSPTPRATQAPIKKPEVVKPSPVTKTAVLNPNVKKQLIEYLLYRDN